MKISDIYCLLYILYVIYIVVWFLDLIVLVWTPKKYCTYLSYFNPILLEHCLFFFLCVKMGNTMRLCFWLGMFAFVMILSLLTICLYGDNKYFYFNFLSCRKELFVMLIIYSLFKHLKYLSPLNSIEDVYL